ncbi:MAG: histidine kinase dimerization/phospho-acceptor domain-containing protein, partial [Myxococcota bacterium]
TAPRCAEARSDLVVYERDGRWFQLKIDSSGPQDFRLLGLGTMLLLLAVAVILPLLSLHRQLGALGDAARRLGEGDTRARVALIAGGRPVHPVAEQVNRMAQEIEDALARNQELLRSVAHEMRTPLSRLVLALDLLQEDTPEARATRIAKLHRRREARHAGHRGHGHERGVPRPRHAGAPGLAESRLVRRFHGLQDLIA